MYVYTCIGSIIGASLVFGAFSYQYSMLHAILYYMILL